MNRKILAPIILVIVFINCFVVQAQSDWVSYVTEKDNGYMAISTDLQYTYAKPTYKNVLIVGTDTKKCHKNGFPTDEGLEEIYTFSDSIANTLETITKSKLVGIVTYQCAGLDVFYVKDTTNLRTVLNNMTDTNFSNRSNHLYINYDKKWTYYQGIYPQSLEDEYFMNHDFLIQLLYQGDDLNKSRNVKHWFYFNNIKKRTKFLNSAKELDFKIDSIKYDKERDYPYELQISRNDSIPPANISNITKMLSQLSNVYRGYYEGWGTEAIKED